MTRGAPARKPFPRPCLFASFEFCVVPVACILRAMDWPAWRIWLAIALLVDAAIGLLGLNTFARFLPARRITRLALAEAAIAVALVIWHFVRRG